MGWSFRYKVSLSLVVGFFGMPQKSFGNGQWG
jgi:hypothetical protein